MLTRTLTSGLILALVGSASWGNLNRAEPKTLSQERLEALSRLEESRTISQLGYGESLELKGSESKAVIGFGSRLDEVIEAGEFRFELTTSPALAPLLSHLKVYLNNELQQVVPINDEGSGRVSHRVVLDPKFFGEYNQIGLELIGHLNKDCWNPHDPSIWAAISRSSEVWLQKRRLRLANDLSLLPAPFFDQGDFRAMRLPVVLGADYSLETVKAAAMATAYFGSLAAWRDARFPVFVDQLPEQHALVLMTNDSRPDFLRDFPVVDKPTLQMITHPENPFVKLLLIQGRDAADLQTAIRGLALGESLFSGPVASINRAVQIQPREPYDAPNWVRTDRPVKLAELVDDPMQLQVSGRRPPAIRVSASLPPDLFTWQSRGIPIDLRYRYTPPAHDNTDSSMNFSLNGQFVEAFSLTEKGINGEQKRVRIPLLDSDLVDAGDRVRIPAFRVGNNNELAFQFAFSAQSEGACRTIAAGNYQAVIESDSTVDFSGFPHYIEMPNLHAFVTSGFPYTRLADLAETAFVLSSQPSVEEVEMLLYLTAYMAGSAGYPGLGLTVTDQWDKSVLEGRDILVLQADHDLAADVSEGEKLSLVLDARERLLKLPARNPKDYRRERQKSADSVVQQTVSVSADGGFAALAGMESPYGGRRSLVAIFAAHPGDYRLVQRAIADGGKHRHMFGSVVTIRGDQVASFHVGDSYHAGHLPLSQLIWYHFSKHPIVLALISLLVIFLMTAALWRLMSRIAARRLDTERDDG